jgi:NDP-sugar pyrophosphorylase family protein
MKAGIIAAGRGERLTQGGISTPKPLVRVGGETLIGRTIRAAASAGATSVACIVNDLSPAVADYVRSSRWPVPLELTVKTTPSSMESLFALAPHLKNEPFLLFTVDAVFRTESLEKFVSRAMALGDAQGVLALTRFADDEKPLWAKVDRRRRIVALGEAAIPGPYVTAGFYYFKPDIFSLMDKARTCAGALRQFLDLLVQEKYALYGIPVSKTIDIDYSQDIEKAENYLRRVKAR